MQTLLDVVKVKANPDYTLYLEFENGETRIFDMAPYMDKKPFVRLKELPLFARAFVDYGTVIWPGNIDIAPETLYDLSAPARSRLAAPGAMEGEVWIADDFDAPVEGLLVCHGEPSSK
jgi:hypothetical protein